MTRLACGLLLSLIIGCVQPLIAESAQDAAANRAEAKLQHLQKNAELGHPDPRPTEFSESEINAYFASGKVKLPEGVQAVSFQGHPGVVTASCLIDFDQVKAGRHSGNPLLSLFSGTHDVVVEASASGAGGEGLVEAQSVMIDGVDIPRFVLELFIQKFLQPKYPNLGMVSRFPLPQKIDTAVVGEHKLIITQK